MSVPKEIATVLSLIECSECYQSCDSWLEFLLRLNQLNILQIEF